MPHPSTDALQATLHATLRSYTPIFWENPHRVPKRVWSPQETVSTLPNMADIEAANARLKRFAPVFERLFPETAASQGMVESPLRQIRTFQKSLIPMVGGQILGGWYAKLDSHLPIAGSIKARGGVYEVITHAEVLAKAAGLLTEDSTAEDYAMLCEGSARARFERHRFVVGSTGNLGLSIGIMGRALGFSVTVHMSSDAKPWKIQLLREKGAEVVLHSTDYSHAVEEGRRAAEADPNAYFIDDEHSRHLFTGYATAALRLQSQLSAEAICVDEAHPLFVYLPCGVGGAPGGIAYALKQLYGDAVYVFFAEPTHAPCMLLGMSSGAHEAASIYDFGLDGVTAADGLAVGRPSGLVSRGLRPLIEGIYTTEDARLHWLLRVLYLSESLRLEPSALAAFDGPIQLMYTAEGFSFLKRHALLERLEHATHISWATGGGMVPDATFEELLHIGKDIDMHF